MTPEGARKRCKALHPDVFGADRRLDPSLLKHPVAEWPEDPQA